MYVDIQLRTSNDVTAESLQELKPPCRLKMVGYILWSNLL